jgi:hypothetical protein
VFDGTVLLRLSLQRQVNQSVYQFSVTSHLFWPTAFNTDRADMRLGSCSAERPPKIKPNRIFLAQSVFLHRLTLPPPLAGQLHFQLQIDPKLLFYSLVRQVDQRKHIGRPGIAQVDDEIGVLPGYFRIPDAGVL